MLDSSDNKCYLDCNSECKTCQLGSPSVCLTCATGYIKSGTTCVPCTSNCEVCAPRYAKKKKGNVCLPCSGSNCAVCKYKRSLQSTIC